MSTNTTPCSSSLDYSEAKSSPRLATTTVASISTTTTTVPTTTTNNNNYHGDASVLANMIDRDLISMHMAKDSELCRSYECANQLGLNGYYKEKSYDLLAIGEGLLSLIKLMDQNTEEEIVLRKMAEDFVNEILDELTAKGFIRRFRSSLPISKLSDSISDSSGGDYMGHDCSWILGQTSVGGFRDVFPSTTEQFFDLLLNDDSNFINEYRSVRKDTNLTIGPWHDADEYDGQVREIKLRALCNSPMYPLDTAMTEWQHAVLSPDKKQLVFETVQQAHDIPFGSYFEASQASLEWLMKKRKAFDRRGDMVVAA
ncbi:hypothetical protein HYC85_022606 [Camellia sinensis]|uniref:VASt domain-containing protein n=1 Tax=Camellia sinensis TaxID=4442 RepID=A0A7J7GCR4_CAMSI|nr:hypothetical protein HYC85_022606 [Camellia sinensis]